jgi:HEPN domain-containing protein
MKKAAKAWMEHARRDFEAARILLKEEYLANVVIFHAQQCVEKCLKALLEEYAIFIPKTHSIVKLYFLLPEAVRDALPLEDNDMDMIDTVYIDTRYPGALALLPAGFPSREEANQLLQFASQVFDAVNKGWPDGA